MDTGAATIIAAAIGAVASVIVAWITTRRKTASSSGQEQARQSSLMDFITALFVLLGLGIILAHLVINSAAILEICLTYLSASAYSSLEYFWRV